MPRTASTRFALLSTALLLALGLAACGGGGGGGGDAPAAQASGTYNVRAAFQNVLTTGGSWQLPEVGTPSAVYTLSITPAAPALFPLTNGTYARSVSNTILGGLKLPPADGTIYYELSGDSVKVIGNQVQNECGATPGAKTASGAAVVSLPTDAQVGASGTVYSLGLQPDCNAATAAGPTADTKWQLLQNAGLVLFCLNNTRSDTNSLASTCIEIDATGKLLTHARFARGPANGTADFNLRNF